MPKEYSGQDFSGNGLNRLGWRFLFCLGILTMGYGVWSLAYLTLNPFSMEQAFGVSIEEIRAFSSSIARWIILQNQLKIVFLSIIIASGVLVTFVAYHACSLNQRWSWFALTLTPLIPLSTAFTVFGQNLLTGIYLVPHIDVPLRVYVVLGIVLYILGISFQLRLSVYRIYLSTVLVKGRIVRAVSNSKSKSTVGNE